ncbi:hypothetical protein DMN91_003733 [Ooceraea biroi]|uniref:Uncharacterized protein n=1 Tax=Ooceraea biroi TaxID=2015173 RepID=A0A3L8DUV1_OOCBI|nr:hypothetical protein DMN91_003733 [Ooceraea biroi]
MAVPCTSSLQDYQPWCILVCGIRAASEDFVVCGFTCGRRTKRTAEEHEGERGRSNNGSRGARGKQREIEGPGVGPKGYVGAAPRPEAARHLGHPYIAKYSRIEKGAIVRMYLKPGTLCFWIRS